MLVCSPRKILILILILIQGLGNVISCVFCRTFSEYKYDENAVVSCLFYPSLVLLTSYCVPGGKTGKTDAIKKVTSKGRDVQYPLDEQTLLQRHQYISIMRKIYQSSRFNNVFRKMPSGNNLFFQISGVRTGVCTYIYAMLCAFFFTFNAQFA